VAAELRRVESQQAPPDLGRITPGITVAVVLMHPTRADGWLKKWLMMSKNTRCLARVVAVQCKDQRRNHNLQ
jgi:hypothetical protein